VSVTLAFIAVVAGVLGAGAVFRRWDRARHLRFVDEAGSTIAVTSIGRFEARQLLRHPTWWIAYVLVGGLVSFLAIATPDVGAVVGQPVVWFAATGLPFLGLGLVVSAHRVGTRARRSANEELESSLPTAPRARTAGLLLACAAPLPVIVAGAAVAVVVTRLASRFTPPLTAAGLAPLSTFVICGVGGAVVGVLLSRWLPVVVGPVVGIVALIWLNNGPGHAHPRFRWLRAGSEVGFGGHFDVVPGGWSVVFLLAIVALGACLALWSHPYRRALAATTAIAVAVIGTTGWSISRPPDRVEVRRVVDDLTGRDGDVTCRRIDGVRYCVHDGAESWTAPWADAVAGVREQVPPAAWPERIVVAQRLLVDERVFLPEIRAELDRTDGWRDVWPDDGAVHPTMALDERWPGLAVGWQVAALAVGLPPSPTWNRPAGCMAGGQARLVLADVLAARSDPTAAAGLRDAAGTVRTDSLEGTAFPLLSEGIYDIDTPQGEGAEVRPGDRRAADGVTWTDGLAAVGASGWGSDVVAAEALLGVDADRLDRTVRDHWDELVSVDTTTARFLELAGVAAPDPERPATIPGDPGACG